jgi:hypothetical protein
LMSNVGDGRTHGVRFSVQSVSRRGNSGPPSTLAHQRRSAGA